MPTLKINDEEVTVQDGITVLQACEQIGIEIPRFCYHERLQIAGNCRMCLVDIKPGPPKPAASCAVNVADGMIVDTRTEMVKKAREGVMEFLLANHPLDCPICDQGGECDLQDQAYIYGKGLGKDVCQKRAVSEKYMGPLIKTHMTRCIHCTRCIRFAEDIAGVEEIGAIGRGEHMEITTLEKALSSELSGNVVDLCPVGALTSKPYAFKARSWELVKTYSIDVMDAMGSSIRIDSRGMEVMRILPRLNEDINEEWISDKTRHICDGLNVQRLDSAYIRNKKGGRLEKCSLDHAISVIAQKLQSSPSNKIAALAGSLIDLEGLFSLKRLMSHLGSSNFDFRQRQYNLNASSRSNYLFNTTFAGIESLDELLIISSNVRKEMPVLNARIRKSVVYNNLKVASVGVDDDVNLTYKRENLGANVQTLVNILNEKHTYSQRLKSAKDAAIILGLSAIEGEGGEHIHNLVLNICKKFNVKFNMVAQDASAVGCLDIGLFTEGAQNISSKASSGEIEFLYLLGADEFEIEPHKNCFIVYQGSHGDNGAQIADVILPSMTYVEKEGIYINAEGRAQLTQAAVKSVDNALDDFEIIEKIISKVGGNSKESKDSLRENIAELYPHLLQLNSVPDAQSYNISCKDVDLELGVFKRNLKTNDFNFYQTNPIARASKTMALCAQALKGK